MAVTDSHYQISDARSLCGLDVNDLPDDVVMGIGDDDSEDHPVTCPDCLTIMADVERGLYNF